MDDPLFPSLSYGEVTPDELMQFCADEFAFLSADSLKEPYPMGDFCEPDICDSGIDMNPVIQTSDAHMRSSSIQHQSQDRVFQASDTWDLPAPDASARLWMAHDLPSPLMSNESYPSLDTTLRGDLIKIYFENVHPLCPIIDEQQFFLHYSVLTDNQFFGRFPSIMFNAMMFVAFAHATEEHANRAGFQSICEVQTVYFRFLTENYAYAQCQISNEMEEVVLAKTALLLSFWCPPKTDITVTSLWIDRAIYHTKQFIRKMSNGTKHNLIPKRWSILYWTCISRNTLVSYAMRRPNCLYIEEELLYNLEDVRSEFDREIVWHSFSSPEGKLRMVEDFVLLCKLSRSLYFILKSQRSMLVELQWKSRRNRMDSLEIEEEDNDELHDYLSRYLEASNYCSELTDLLEEHENCSLSFMERDNNEVTTEDLLARMRRFYISMITHSSIVSLYQFTLSTTSGSWARSCHKTALRKLKESSDEVSSTVGRLLEIIPIEAIPGAIIYWTMSPMITYIVDQNCNKFGLTQFSADDDLQHNETDTVAEKIGNLLKLAEVLAPRFQSARDACHLMRNVDHILCIGAAVRDGRDWSPGPARTESDSRRDLHSSYAVGDKEAAYLGLLNQGMQFLDREIANGSLS